MEKVNNSNDDEEELDGKRAVTYQVSFRFLEFWYRLCLFVYFFTYFLRNTEYLFNFLTASVA